MSLSGELAAASDIERQGIAALLISGMSIGNAGMNAMYAGVCEEVYSAQNAPLERREDEPMWAFSAQHSVELVGAVYRVRGFLNAIERTPLARTAIDAGCGASALLAVGIAVRHPGAEVIGYEINEPAADCAREVVRLFGFAGRISIVAGNVLELDLPEVDMGVTETFDRALTREPGPAIVAKLATRAATVLPATAKLYATDDPEARRISWQQANDIDLREPRTHITGMFTSTGEGLRRVHARAMYYNVHGWPILKDMIDDHIVAPLPLGGVQVPRRGAEITFSYPVGQDLALEPAQLSVGA